MHPEYVPSKDEVEGELDDMKKQSIILKVHEPTDWVKSIVYALANLLCLDAKDLKKVIKCHHHKAAILKELNHKLSDAGFFTKLNRKYRYWSIKLYPES